MRHALFEQKCDILMHFLKKLCMMHTSPSQLLLHKRQAQRLRDLSNAGLGLIPRPLHGRHLITLILDSMQFENTLPSCHLPRRLVSVAIFAALALLCRLTGGRALRLLAGRPVLLVQRRPVRRQRHVGLDGLLRTSLALRV